MDGNTTTTILGLPDLVLLNIVSFLCDTSVSTPVSMKMMLAFASTNKCLRHRLRNDVLPSFSIQARLNHSSAFIQYRTLKLISTYKCKVKHLAVKVGKKDSGILLELMRRFLNCSELECLETYLFHDSVDHFISTLLLVPPPPRSLKIQLTELAAQVASAEVPAATLDFYKIN